MGITFKGHDNDWQYWVFDIDGRDFVAVNQSTQTPLKIQFQGRYRNWGNTPISKVGGFDIVSSTVSKTGPDGEKQGIVEWVWNGVRYKSAWGLYPGNEIIAGDLAEGIEAVWDYQLIFTTGVPYSGPTGGSVGTSVVSQTVIEAAKNKEDREIAEATTQISPSAQLSTDAPVQTSPRPVGTGIVSQAVIQAQQSGGAVGNSSAAVGETQDALAAANKALAYSESQGTVNIQALNNARVELQNAKDALAAAESRSTQGQTVLMSQLREQVDAIQERTDTQVKIYQQMLAQAQAAQAASAAAVGETKDALAAANKALAYSESQGTVNSQALNNARVELQNAKDALAAAEARSTQNQAVLMSQLREQVDAIQERTDTQIKIYQQMVLQSQKAAQTPSGGGTTPVVIPGTGLTQSPVTTGGGTTTPPAPTAVAGTDWVKLGLQIGAAYLLLS
jgi:hypothetical protein